MTNQQHTHCLETLQQNTAATPASATFAASASTGALDQYFAQLGMKRLAGDVYANSSRCAIRTAWTIDEQTWVFSEILRAV